MTLVSYSVSLQCCVATYLSNVDILSLVRYSTTSVAKLYELVSTAKCDLVAGISRRLRMRFRISAILWLTLTVAYFFVGMSTMRSLYVV